MHAAPLMLLALLTGCGRGPEPLPEPSPWESPVEDTGELPVEEPIRELAAEDAAVAVIRGEANQQLGKASFGDLTGDHHTDALVMAAPHTGVVAHVIPGPLLGDISVDRAIATLPHGDLGSYVADLNGDGHDDVALVQGPILVPYEFQIYLGPLSPKGPPTQPDMALRPSQKGFDGFVCDANLDGAADLVVYDDGVGPNSYRMVLGPLTEPNMGDEAYDVVFEGNPAGGSQPSRRLLCGHDLTGSGGADLLFNTNGSGNIVWLIEDPDWSGWQSVHDVGEPTVLRNGYLDALAAPGDVTGDGYLDVYSGYGIRGQLVAGPMGADNDLYATFEWDSDSTSVASVGDLDGDGHDDLVVGLGTIMAQNYTSYGAVYLLHGPLAPGGYDVDDVDLILTPGAGGDAGPSVFGQDLQVDPRSPLWGASAHGAEGPGPHSGHAYIFSGWPGL